LVDDYVAAFAMTTESLESIPSVDGRICTSDGQVIAEDVERYNISVHYRWLEDPPNDRWLLKQALSKLPRAQRRNRGLVDAQKQRVLALRDQLWRRLTELTGTSADRLAAQRKAIQQRVERIAEIVEKRRGERESKSTDSTDSPTVDDASAPLATRIWN